MKVILQRNYEKGNKRLLKGAEINVTPWFYVELKEGGFLDIKKPKKFEPKGSSDETNVNLNNE